MSYPYKVTIKKGYIEWKSDDFSNWKSILKDLEAHVVVVYLKAPRREVTAVVTEAISARITRATFV